MFMSDTSQGKGASHPESSTDPLDLASIETLASDRKMSPRNDSAFTTPVPTEATDPTTEVETGDITASFSRINVSTTSDLHWASALDDVSAPRNLRERLCIEKLENGNS